ncbi:MAG: hypothetical protein QM674_01025, partial [Burkholderiaceae bacterium]
MIATMEEWTWVRFSGACSAALVARAEAPAGPAPSVTCSAACSAAGSSAFGGRQGNLDGLLGHIFGGQQQRA